MKIKMMFLFFIVVLSNFIIYGCITTTSTQNNTTPNEYQNNDINILIAILIALISGVVGAFVGSASNFLLFQIEKRRELYEDIFQNITSYHFNLELLIKICKNETVNSKPNSTISRIQFEFEREKMKVELYPSSTIAQLEFYTKRKYEITGRAMEISRLSSEEFEFYNNFEDNDLITSSEFIQERTTSSNNIKKKIQEVSKIMRGDLGYWCWLRSFIAVHILHNENKWKNKNGNFQKQDNENN